jgi:hypothetical protein
VKQEAFQGTLDICERHAERLRWAMTTLGKKFPLSPETLERLTDIDLAVVDQFIVRFSKLQDAIGAKLLPGVLELTKALGLAGVLLDAFEHIKAFSARYQAAHRL